MSEQAPGINPAVGAPIRPEWWIVLMGQAIAQRAAQHAASQASDPIAAVSEAHKAAAESLYRFTGDVGNATGRQCLLWPGFGNGLKYFNYETLEWEEDC